MIAKKRTWYVGMVLVVVLVLVAGWMLVVAPKRTATAEVRAQADQVEKENLVLERKVSELRTAFAQIEDLREAVRQDRRRIPTSLELSELLDTLNKVAEDAEVSITSIEAADVRQVLPSHDVILLPSEREAAEKAKAEAKSSQSKKEDSDDAEEPAATAKPADPMAEFREPQIPGYSALPISIEIVGTSAQSLAFVDALQGGIERNFMSSVYSTAVGAGSAKLDDVPEDPMTTVIEGWFYVLASSYDPDATTREPTSEPTEPEPLPTLGTRNPFVVTGD